MEVLIPSIEEERQVSPLYFSREFRKFLAGPLAQTTFSFAKTLGDVAVRNERGDVLTFLATDALLLYDFLLIVALQPQTVSLLRSELVVKRGAEYTNMRFGFYNQEAKLHLGLQEEPGRQKIQANLMRPTLRRVGKKIEVPFIGISASSWLQQPVEVEMVLGRTLGGQRFFPMEPEEHITKGDFNNYFDELEALYGMNVSSRFI